MIKAARAVGGTGDSEICQKEECLLFNLAAKGCDGKESFSLTSPDFGVDDGGGFGLFLGFFVRHSSIIGWVEVVVLIWTRCFETRDGIGVSFFASGLAHCGL